jgi:hypothetical protein
MCQMSAKHYIIYYQAVAGTYVVTEPRPWARGNQSLFPAHDFITSEPNVDSIERYLIQHQGFNRVVSTPEIVVLINVDPSLVISST